MDFERMLRYCAELELNNNRQWFHATHDSYLAAKDDFTRLVELVKYRVANFVTPDMAEKLLFADTKSMMFRIPRDARVWKNLPPYNPSWRAYIAPDRKAFLPVGYFIMIAPGGKSHFGTGAWAPEKELITRVRDYIADNFDRFDEALEQSGLPIEGRSLKRVPPGYDIAEPWADYMKFKEWYVIQRFDDLSLCSFDDFEKTIDRCIERMEPLRRFFDDALSGRQKSPWDDEDVL